jgi:hypothetical protein
MTLISRHSASRCFPHHPHRERTSEFGQYQPPVVFHPQ